MNFEARFKINDDIKKLLREEKRERSEIIIDGDEAIVTAKDAIAFKATITTILHTLEIYEKV